jgi:hypothetical protein
MAILEHQDLVTIIDRPQPVRDKHARAALFFQNAVDVLQERLFGVGV